MEAIGIVPGEGRPRFVERAEPVLDAVDDIKVRVLSVGICGTDREQSEGGRALAPPGSRTLVIGHEMFGEVVDTGSDVTTVAPGDLAVFTVRRGCDNCLPCKMNRPDMCRTGDLRERGIWGLDGYQAPLVVDTESYVVRVPDELESVGVLCEPLSVAEKAVDECIRLQEARLPGTAATPNWLHGRRTLVAGLGPIGLLAALALRLRGAVVYGLDIVDANTARPQWLKAMGGRYIDGREIAAHRIDEDVAEMDVIVEAAGVAKLGFNLIDALALDGVYVLTGIPGGDRPVDIPAADLMRSLVLGNRLMVGSVNASQAHFRMAVEDLTRAAERWPGHLDKLITHRYPHRDFEEALQAHPSDAIKSIIAWAQRPNRRPLSPPGRGTG